MKKAYVLIMFFALGMMSCTKNPSNPVNTNLNVLSFKWQYIYLSKCPYNPASLAPCYIFSRQNTEYWNPDSSYLIIDTTGNCFQNIQGINGAQTITDSFHVVEVNDSLFHISSPSWAPTSIKIKILQEHLLVLEYIADPFKTVYETDSLVK